MFEKVNPAHPDKIADRIAGAIVDYAYTVENDPKIAVEVLIGHGICNIVIESSVEIPATVANNIVDRIVGEKICVAMRSVDQDGELAKNQANGIRCGDNGIFKGVPETTEQRTLTRIASRLYEKYKSDGKYILDTYAGQLIICQSNASFRELNAEYSWAIINPLGSWTGGIDVDSGATNRKLGSDMGDSITGGGLHGKDLSKSDVAINIYAWLKAQEIGHPVELHCAIGDNEIDGKPYSDVVEIARNYIKRIGGFEKFAEWGLIRPIC